MIQCSCDSQTSADSDNIKLFIIMQVYEVQCYHMYKWCLNQDWTWGTLCILAGKRYTLIVKSRYTGHCLNQHTNIGILTLFSMVTRLFHAKKTPFLEMLFLRSSCGNKHKFINVYMILFSCMRYMCYYRPTSVLIILGVVPWPNGNALDV